MKKQRMQLQQQHQLKKPSMKLQQKEKQMTTFAATVFEGAD